MTSSIKEDSNLLKEKDNISAPASPVKRRKSVGNKISEFFSRLTKKNSVVSEFSDQRSKKKPTKKSKTTPVATEKLDFGLEDTPTLAHFERPKPPRDRRKPTRKVNLVPNSSAKITPIAETILEKDESDSVMQELSKSLMASTSMKLLKSPSSDANSVGGGSPKRPGSGDLIDNDQVALHQTNPNEVINNGIETNPDPVILRKQSNVSMTIESYDRLSTGSRRIITPDHSVHIRKSSSGSIGSNKDHPGSRKGSILGSRGSMDHVPNNRESYGGMSNRGSIGSNGSHRASLQGSNRSSVGSKHSSDRFTQRMISHEEEKNEGIENPTSL